MKVREKNPVTKEMIVKLRRKSLDSNKSFWEAVAKGLNRPRRKQYEVNLVRLEKYANPKETVVIVPGTVLGSGEIKKKLTVAALRFSGKAKEKIEKAGGKCLSMEELMEQGPKGKNIMIMGLKMKQSIINADNCITGRLASFVAKSLLNGEGIMVVNAEKAVISGKPESVLNEFRIKVDRGDPYHGPFYPKRPERIFRRIVRGMLPYHKSRGRDAFRRLKVFVSVPEEFKNEKLETIDKTRNKIEGKFITLEKLSEKICGG